LDDLAAKTGLSATTIRRRLVLCDLCDEAQQALAAACSVRFKSGHLFAVWIQITAAFGALASVSRERG
ncbi:MAG: hypothetical protein COB68_12155, partial [SAR202 cluster bacterium]